jgi:hypothetical protein
VLPPALSRRPEGPCSSAIGDLQLWYKARVDLIAFIYGILSGLNRLRKKGKWTANLPGNIPQGLKPTPNFLGKVRAEARTLHRNTGLTWGLAGVAGSGGRIGRGARTCSRRINGSGLPPLRQKKVARMGHGARTCRRRINGSGLPPLLQNGKKQVLRLRCALLRMTARMGHGAFVGGAAEGHQATVEAMLSAPATLRAVWRRL